jgi:hypothetical protein
MRTSEHAAPSHVGVIDRNGGPAEVAAKLQRGGLAVRKNTIACWVSRNSIPRAYWQALERLEMATIAELKAAREQRRRARIETRLNATANPRRSPATTSLPSSSPTQQV